ncbi:unnamed protein product [Adineta steineri]|uniref:GNAT family N-acetyltransferase n=1 Tax=Adineta steineri TaxID=433720 RepID=A0A815PG66_9BILA|nr:unnamed protein product [Adineta steineri]CAF3899123.1 unnamed protein product [Adineta steineri]
MISIDIVQSEEDILGIVALLQINLRRNLSLDKQSSNGFVSIEYEPKFLQKINQLAPSIIAKDSTSKVVGYSLVILPQIAVELPELNKIILLINKLEYKNIPLQNYTYYIMGQVCIASDYRGQKIFDRMLHKHRELYADRYQLLITDISDKNIPSFRAHARVGFETIYSYNDPISNETWHIVLWDWRK